MFKCQRCDEKNRLIEFLQEQNKDLLNRLMAFNKDAFSYYNAQTKQGEPLYPHAIDEKGEKIEYKDVDLKKMLDETYRAFGEDVINVEEELKVA